MSLFLATRFSRRLPALFLVLLAALLALMPGPAALAQGAPSVTGVEVTSDAGDDDTYALGETITVTVTFSEAVDVTGTPQLKIDMDPAEWGTKVVDYASGSGTASLTFDHEVVEPNYSTQGIALLENSLALNGGTVRSSTSGDNAALAHTGLEHDPEHKVNWQLSPGAPWVTEVEVTSDAGDDDTYLLGETITVTVTFSETVNVTGAPQLKIDMDPADWGTKVVDYESGSGTAALTFDHEVVEPNYSTQGIAVLENSLALNGGTIKSASSDTDATLTHTGLDHDPEHKVDWQRSQPNRAPVVDTEAENYALFTREMSVPRGTLVSKPFYQVFSDPDGDELAYSVSISEEYRPLLELLAVGLEYRTPENSHRSPEVFHRVWFHPDADDDWDAIDPALPDPVTVTATLTATDPDGLSVSRDTDFTIDWEPGPDCELAPPESVSMLGVARAGMAFWQAPSGDDACEPTGYMIGARSLDGGEWVVETAPPEARSYLLDGLTPGQIEYYVGANYPQGPSKRPRALPQSVIPEACDISLTVAADVDRGISGTWSNVAGMPTGCVFGETVEFQYKESTWDYFRNYGRFNNHRLQNPTQKSFISYGLKPGVAYDFKIVAVDAAGRKNESNVASATVVYDVSATADANSPTDLRVQPDNNSGVVVSWDAPASAGAGRTLTGYVVEWRSGTTSTTTVGADTTSHRITGLTDGSSYTVRVAARTTGTSPTTRDAWTVRSAPFTAWSEPTQVWFRPELPRILFRTVFVGIETNKAWTIGFCNVTIVGPPSQLACPPNATVQHAATGDITSDVTVTASITHGDEATSTGSSRGTPGAPGGFQAVGSGGAAPSDSDPMTHEGRIAVAWGVPSSGLTGTFKSYFVAHSLVGSTADATVTRMDTDDRFHTITGLADGTYKVVVFASTANVEDHDNDPMTPDEEVERSGFTSTEFEVTVNANNTAVPGQVTGGRVTPGPGSLIAEWEPPDGDASAVHAYQVRYRDGEQYYGDNNAGWTDGPVIYPHQTLRMCGFTGCENPRRYEITALTGGHGYDVAVRARNANGWGEWWFIGEAIIANGVTPVLQSAAVNGASLTLTFDQTIDTDSKPDADAFTVNVNGTDQTPTAVGISEKTVTLTLGTAVTRLSVVRVSYDRPALNPLQHDDAQTPSFTNQSVTNNTP